MCPVLKGLPIRIVFSAEIAFPVPAKRKHRSPIIGRINPNLKFFIVLPSFLRDCFASFAMTPLEVWERSVIF
jgi:hypothetical protein